MKFQSTHPRGVRRLMWEFFSRGGAYFNPRTRVGCDSLESGKPEQFNISIHAPAWGAT